MAMFTDKLIIPSSLTLITDRSSHLNVEKLNKQILTWQFYHYKTLENMLDPWESIPMH